MLVISHDLCLYCQRGARLPDLHENNPNHSISTHIHRFLKPGLHSPNFLPDFAVGDKNHNHALKKFTELRSVYRIT